MRERVIAGALKLFNTYGVKAVTMDDIAHALGMSKRTIYENFRDKDELLISCVARRIRSQAMFDNLDLGILDLLINYYQNIEKLYSSVNGRCFSDIRKYHSKVYLYLKGNMCNYATMCRDRVGAGMKDGYIRPDIQPNLLYMVLLRHMMALFFSDRQPLDETPSRSQADVVLIFTRGIATPLGLQYIEDELNRRASLCCLNAKR